MVIMAMEEEMTLYRATDSRYANGTTACGWTWWTPTREWAERYGSTIIQRAAAGLRLLALPLDGPDVREALEASGIDTDGIDFEMEVDGTSSLDLEVHQILSSAIDGPELARRINAAGYDGVTHPDNLEGAVGEAVALGLV